MFGMMQNINNWIFAIIQTGPTFVKIDIKLMRMIVFHFFNISIIWSVLVVIKTTFFFFFGILVFNIDV